MRKRLIALSITALTIASIFGGGSGLNAAAHVLGQSGLN